MLENQRIEYGKPFVKLNNIICGCYIIIEYTLILVLRAKRKNRQTKYSLDLQRVKKVINSFLRLDPDFQIKFKLM